MNDTILADFPRSKGLATVQDRLLGLVRKEPGGRLTLTTGVPVTASDVTGATTIYYTPCIDDMISLWDGGRWVWSSFLETPLALGTLTSAKPYDVFGYLLAGALALEINAWTNDTTRVANTGVISIQNGRWCKTADKTRLYLGSFYTTSTTTTEMSAANALVFNAYNPRRHDLLKKDASSSWTLGVVSAWGPSHSSTANRIKIMRGLDENSVFIAHVAAISGTSSAAFGIGVDTTVTPTGTTGYLSVSGSLAPACTAIYNGRAGVGMHYYQMIEYGETGSSTVYGSGISYVQCGLTGACFA